MVISHNSQLGLRFTDNLVKKACFYILEENLDSKYKKHKERLTEKITELRGIIKTVEESGAEKVDQTLYFDIMNDKIVYPMNNSEAVTKVNILFGDNQYLDLFNDEKSSFYFICDSVYKASELIKISENFTGRTLKDIKFGKYTYLMGKNKMVRFLCGKGFIKGIFYNDKDNIAFEWGIEMESGDYFFDIDYGAEFTMVMKVLAFVELGDIEILELQGGKNNGGKKDDDKITNTTRNTVYVVDSTWNKIIIRTDGFAVRGHFRLQPCGKNMADRILIWISAFEKHGYKRLPKASIVR